MAYHAFVVMPYGTKEEIDFNRVYGELIKPALEGAGFQVFRADEEMRAGDIRTDMFQELLLADLVVADLSIDNPNVWYELGVRHALRARGVIGIRCRRDYMPFERPYRSVPSLQDQRGRSRPNFSGRGQKSACHLCHGNDGFLVRKEDQSGLSSAARPQRAGFQVVAGRRSEGVLVVGHARRYREKRKSPR